MIIRLGNWGLLERWTEKEVRKKIAPPIIEEVDVRDFLVRTGRYPKGGDLPKAWRTSHGRRVIFTREYPSK